MVTQPQPESKPVHPLARFVTREALALHLKIQPEDIREIRCWRYVIHVVGKGVSTFVSYADLPPILGVEPPTARDIGYWRKRWKKNEFNKAPEFWVEFYAQKFRRALYVEDLYAWGALVGAIAFGISQAAVQSLRSLYVQERESCQLSF